MCVCLCVCVCVCVCHAVIQVDTAFPVYVDKWWISFLFSLIRFAKIWQPFMSASDECLQSEYPETVWFVVCLESRIGESEQLDNWVEKRILIWLCQFLKISQFCPHNDSMLMKIVLICLSFANTNSWKGKDWEMRQRTNLLDEWLPIIP